MDKNILRGKKKGEIQEERKKQKDILFHILGIGIKEY